MKNLKKLKINEINESIVQKQIAENGKYKSTLCTGRKPFTKNELPLLR